VDRRDNAVLMTRTLHASVAAVILLASSLSAQRPAATDAYVSQPCRAIDTLGRVEPGSFHLLKASDDRFVPSVRVALRDMRFLPAELCGHKVRQLTMQPFIFDVSP
jgi:hypothetical protein